MQFQNMAKTKKKRLGQRAKIAGNAKVNNDSTSEKDMVIEDATEDLVKQLGSGKDDVDCDARSVITNKMLRNLNLKKKEKQKLKHSVWKKRVSTALEARDKELNKKKKRQHIAEIVGDMSSMLESLPIEVLLNKVSSQTACKRERKVRSVETESFRQQQKLSNISLFRSVLYHPEYKSNPMQTVTEHLRNKLNHENNDG